MVKHAKIVVVGSINMDLVVSAPRIPLPGETIMGKEFDTIFGGKGANQAVAARRLGAQVDLIGCIGDDAFGQDILTHLSKEGVGVEHIALTQVATGVALITVSDAGENAIVVSPGANSKLTPEHVKNGEERIQEADIVLVQLEIPIEAVEEAILLAKKHGVKVILNPAPARDLPHSILKNIDILTPNETEGRILLTQDANSQLRGEDIIQRLNQKGIDKILLTQGAHGVSYNEGSQVRHVPGYQVKVVDTTAAGDAFNAGLGVALAEGFPFEEAVDFAQKAASLAVTKHGAQPSLPFRSQIN
ncbi:ribokinase [Ammoniphilus sp. YIM 78166]|uniref:ribokinase n=1 Tax=Ammoniphilus sp. YIM 78166 TaxID=1644106 RepID=UPI00107065A3|nr:ribokinase [Ammoniphilus sp. YIM 78166]